MSKANRFPWPRTVTAIAVRTPTELLDGASMGQHDDIAAISHIQDAGLRFLAHGEVPSVRAEGDRMNLRVRLGGRDDQAVDEAHNLYRTVDESCRQVLESWACSETS